MPRPCSMQVLRSAHDLREPVSVRLDSSERGPLLFLRWKRFMKQRSRMLLQTRIGFRIHTNSSDGTLDPPNAGPSKGSLAHKSWTGDAKRCTPSTGEAGVQLAGNPPRKTNASNSHKRREVSPTALSLDWWRALTTVYGQISIFSQINLRD